MLEVYQTKVLGWDKIDKANTGYETRVIGNLLLPPTNRTPQGRGVFIVPGMDPNAGPADATKKIAVKASKMKPGARVAVPTSANDLQHRLEQMAQHIDTIFDTDLTDIIMKHAENGDLIRDILSDPAVNGVFDKDSVRASIKGLLKSGKISKDPETGVLVASPEEDWLQTKVRNAGTRANPGVRPEVDDEPDVIEPDENEGGAVEEPIDDTVPSIDAADEENVDINIPDRPSWEAGDDEDDMLLGDEEDDIIPDDPLDRPITSEEDEEDEDEEKRWWND